MKSIEEALPSINALNNATRLKILEIVSKEDKDKHNSVKKRLRLSSYDIKYTLDKRYNINISRQAVDKHLEKLVDSSILVRDKSIRSGKPDIYVYNIDRQMLQSISQQINEF